MNARQNHLAQLGLVRNPFPPTPDAGCYFSTPHLHEQMVELAHCIGARKGFCLLTAEVGMGKSTLVRHLMADLAPQGVVSALVFNTFLQGPDLLAAVLQDFGLHSSGSMATDMAELNAFLLQKHHAGKTCLLVIDDAQNLSEASLELVRLLCNLETDQEKLLQIMLAGQPELEDMLALHNLRQLRSRIVKHARLHGLGSTEIADYVRFRFDSAGSDGALLLQTEACRLLWQETQGVPRQIHLVLDRCLYGLAARQGNVIDAALMQQALADSRVQLHGAASAPAAAAPAARQRTARAHWLPALTVLLAGALVWQARDGALVPQAWARDWAAAPAALLALWQPAAEASAAAPEAQEPDRPTPQPQPQPQPEPEPALQPEPDPVAGPQEAPAAAPALLQAAGVTAAAACDTSTISVPGRLGLSQPVPGRTLELLGERLKRLGTVCLDVRQGQTWATWTALQPGNETQERLAAVRLQMALAVYGSLRPQDIDGVWGSKSAEALQQFQSAVGLSTSGSMDALSRLFLEKLYVPEQ